MIRRGNHSAEFHAFVTLPSGEYGVNYRLEGKCYSDPGKLYGPPEDCYPPEGEAEVYSVGILEVTDANGAIVPAEPVLGTAILAKIHELPIDEYLLESWAESDYE